MKYIIISILLTLSVYSYSQIEVNTNFKPNIAAPMDLRYKIATLADTSAITFPYLGAIAYVTSKDSVYYLGSNGWKPIGKGLSASGVNPIDSTVLAAGTGVSVVESPSNTYTVTNTAPDQTVTISGATGTYPNFTLPADDDNQTLTLLDSINRVFRFNISGGNTVKMKNGILGVKANSASTLFVTSIVPAPDTAQIVFTRPAVPGRAFYVGPNTVPANFDVPTFRAIVPTDIPTLNQNTTGSAARLTTGRTIAITGDLTYTSPAFTGQTNITAAGTLATVNSNVGTFTNPSITVNAKGLVTAISSGTIDSTSVLNSYGTIITESPNNTFNIKVDSTKFATTHDLTLVGSNWTLAGTNLSNNNTTGKVSITKSMNINSPAAGDAYPLIVQNNASGLGGIFTNSDNSKSVYLQPNSSLASNSLWAEGSTRIDGVLRNSANSGGTSGQVLTSQGNGSAWTWTTPSSFTLPSLTSGSVLFSNGTTIVQDNANFFFDDTNNRLGLGRNSSLTARLTLEDAGGVAVHKAIGFQNSGGWGDTWISKFNDADSRRGLHISGANISSGETTAMTVDHFNGAKVGINNTTPTSLLHIGNASDQNGLTIDRGVNESISAKFLVNTDGDLIFRTTSGNMSIAPFTGTFASYNPSAKIHLFAPSGASTVDMFKMEKASGFGSSVIRQYYDGTTFKYGMMIGDGYSATNYLTLQHNDGFVGVGVDLPTRKLDVNGNTRIRGALYDNGNSSGTTGQVLTSAGGGAWTWSTPLTISGTLNTIPFYNTTTTLASMPIYYDNALPAMTVPAGNAIRFISTASIIDKGNSYGAAGQVLMKPADGTGGMLWTNTSGLFTEVDGSITNEGYQGVTTGGANSAVIQGYNSAGTTTGSGTTLNGNFMQTITETTSTNGGAITLNAAAPYTMMGFDGVSHNLSTTYSKLPTEGGSSYNGDASYLTFDNTNDEIDILTSGTYKVSYNCNCKSNTSGHTVTFDVLNTTTLGSASVASNYYFNSTNDYSSNGNYWIAPLTSGQSFALYAKTSTGTPNINTCSVRFMIERLK